MTSDNGKTRDETDSIDEEVDDALADSTAASDDSATAPDTTDDTPHDDVETAEKPFDPSELMNADALILSEKMGKFGTLDRWVYNLEVIIVVTALIVMSITVFVDVIYQLVVGLSQDLAKGDASAYTTIGGILAFFGLMAFAATGDNSVWDPEAEESVEKAEAKPLAVRLGVVAGTIVASFAVGWAILSLESTTVYRVILIALVAPVIWMQWDRGETRAVGILGGSTLISLYLFGNLPTGYSWAQSYSLLLLLWVGFLGASIAARERRHLRVDLVRKLLPANKVPAFNAVSYVVAAAFTAVVLYLGYIYIFGSDSTYLRPIWNAPEYLPESTRQMLMTEFPLPDDASFWRRFQQVVFAPSEPGEIPDWLKVMAIPVSMGLVAIRFLGHAFVFGRMAVRGESFSEATGIH